MCCILWRNRHALEKEFSVSTQKTADAWLSLCEGGVSKCMPGIKTLCFPGAYADHGVERALNGCWKGSGILAAQEKGGISRDGKFLI
jgi:hypothetical protein